MRNLSINLKQYRPSIPVCEWVRKHAHLCISGEKLLRYRNNFASAFKYKQPYMVVENPLLSEVYLIRGPRELEWAVRTGNKLLLVKKAA